MINELDKEKLGLLRDAQWPFQVLQSTATANQQGEVLLATLKMLSPLAIHLSPAPLKLF